MIRAFLREGLATFTAELRERTPVEFGPEINSGRLHKFDRRGVPALLNSVGPPPPFCKISGIIVLAGNSSQDPDVKELRY